MPKLYDWLYLAFSHLTISTSTFYAAGLLSCLTFRCNKCAFTKISTQSTRMLATCSAVLKWNCFLLVLLNADRIEIWHYYCWQYSRSTISCIWRNVNTMLEPNQIKISCALYLHINSSTFLFNCCISLCHASITWSRSSYFDAGNSRALPRLQLTYSYNILVYYSLIRIIDHRRICSLGLRHTT